MRESVPSPASLPEPVPGSELGTLPGDGSGIREAYVDFIVGLDYLSPNAGLLKLFHRAMSAYGLSLLLVNHTSVKESIVAVRKGRLVPRVYLDLSSRPGDAFYDLLHAMAEAGAHTICKPGHLQWTLKANTHPVLEAAGLPVPPTVIFRKDDADRELTAEERARVGDRVVIKPSYGVAGLGAVIGAEPTRQAIASARDYDRRDDWLVQRMMSWTNFGDRAAYLRAYNILGVRTLMWWDSRGGYRVLTWDDCRKYHLGGALELVGRVARAVGLEFFSTEIAITSEDPQDPNRYVLIDYVNDQCDIDPEADPNRSPPAQWVAWVCQQFARMTWQRKRRVHDEEASAAGGAGIHLFEEAPAR